MVGTPTSHHSWPQMIPSRDNNMQSIDIYAATNPAFTAIVLYEFCKSFSSCNEKRKVSYPLLFIVLPIILSRKGVNSFEGTNVTTGFFEWLNRHQEIKIGLAENIQLGMPWTKSALRFAIHHRLLETTGYEYFPSTQVPWKKPNWPASDERGNLLSCTRKLGFWLAKVPNEATIFHALGVQP